MDMKSISQKLQDDIRDIMEANIKHPNHQALDVHEPEKDEITAHDFKKLRAMKKDQHGKITKEDTDDQIQELAGKAAQQAAIAISLIKAGKKDGKMPKPMKEDSEQVEEEEKKKVVSPFDYKNYQSQIPKKPGETAGFDSKKISTGTVYSRKPVKEESHQSATTMKHIPNPSPALKDAAKRIKPGIAGIRDRFDMLRAGGVKGGPGGVKEEAQIDELSKSTLGSYLTKKTSEYMKGKTQPGSKEHAKDVQNMGKAYDKLKKEEVEQMDELSTSTLKSYISSAQKNRASQSDSKNSGDREEANYAKKQIVKRTLGIVDAKSRLNKEEVESETIAELSTGTLLKVKHAAVRDANDATRDSDDARADKRYNLAGKASNKIELRNRAAGLKPSGQHALESVEQEEYTFADYLEAARAQYVDEDAVLVANEAFKNKDITLFNYQSQSPEA